VTPGGGDLPLRRKLVYRTRAAIARWSHRLALAAHRFDRPGLYLRPARAALTLYGALAWGHGRTGAMVERWLGPSRR
jgi:hypothetical protein